MSIRRVDPDTGLVERDPPRPYPFGPSTMAAVLDGPLVDRPDSVALIDGDRTWTYDELNSVVERAAGTLYENGLRPGDRLLWSTASSAESIIGFLASQRLALIWVGVAVGPEIHRLRVELDPAHQILDDVAATGLIDKGRRAPPPVTDVDPHAPAAIAFTSGSTGAPKGVVHTQHSMLAPGLVSVDVDPPDEDERIGTPFPLTTLNLLLLGPTAAFLRGSTAVVMRRRFAAGFAEDVRRHRITKTFLVPTMLRDLVDDESVEPVDLSTLRSVIVGGDGAPHELRNAFAERFGVRPTMSYGLTEAPTGVVRERATGSYPLPHVVVRVIGGELCVSPATEGKWAHTWTPTLGYWRRPDLTAELFRGGVLHTGDRGEVAHDGSVSVIGRIAEMIVRGGANVDPGEVEEIILTHAAVVEAAVVGLDDERLGHVVGAAVVAREPIEPAEIIAHVSAHLADYKVPELLAVVDELPKNPAGKVDRTALRVHFAKG